MQIEDLMTDLGLGSAEALGMTCLCGMSASQIYAREGFPSEVSIFSALRHRREWRRAPQSKAAPLHSRGQGRLWVSFCSKPPRTHG
jgi:hypothetical protein